MYFNLGMKGVHFVTALWMVSFVSLDIVSIPVSDPHRVCVYTCVLIQPYLPYSLTHEKGRHRCFDWLKQGWLAEWSMIQRLAKAIRGVVKCELLFWKSLHVHFCTNTIIPSCSTRLWRNVFTRVGSHDLMHPWLAWQKPDSSCCYF